MGALQVAATLLRVGTAALRGAAVTLRGAVGTLLRAAATLQRAAAALRQAAALLRREAVLLRAVLALPAAQADAELWRGCRGAAPSASRRSNRQTSLRRRQQWHKVSCRLLWGRLGRI